MSALLEAHTEILTRALGALLEAQVGLEGILVPLTTLNALQLLERELEAMAHLGADWEQALDGLASMVMEGDAP